MQTRLGILWNNTDTPETCPLCHQQFKPSVGYRVFFFTAQDPAIASQPVCDPCVRKREPELLQMIELQQSYEAFHGQMVILDNNGVLSPRKGGDTPQPRTDRR
jgi:hypothetical protein